MAEMDERATAAIAPLLDDPEGIWHRAVMVSRHPHAKPVMDAWHGLTRVGKLAETPELAKLTADLDRAGTESPASEARALSNAVREATESLTGDMRHGEFTPAPLGGDWPPRVMDGARMPMLAIKRE